MHIYAGNFHRILLWRNIADKLWSKNLTRGDLITAT